MGCKDILAHGTGLGHVWDAIAPEESSDEDLGVCEVNLAPDGKDCVDLRVHTLNVLVVWLVPFLQPIVTASHVVVETHRENVSTTNNDSTQVIRNLLVKRMSPEQAQGIIDMPRSTKDLRHSVVVC